MDWSINGHSIASSDNQGRLCVFDLENETTGKEHQIFEGKKCLKMDPIFKEDFIENEMAINEVKFY